MGNLNKESKQSVDTFVSIFNSFILANKAFEYRKNIETSFQSSLERRGLLAFAKLIRNFFQNRPRKSRLSYKKGDILPHSK